MLANVSKLKLHSWVCWLYDFCYSYTAFHHATDTFGLFNHKSRCKHTVAWQKLHSLLMLLGQKLHGSMRCSYLRCSNVPSVPCVVCRTWWCLWVTLWTGWSRTSPRTSASRCTRRRSSWWSSLWRRSRAKGLQCGTTTTGTTAPSPRQPIRALHSRAHGPSRMQTAVKMLAARV